MPEGIVYLSEDVHVGQLREATYDLLGEEFRVVNTMFDSFYKAQALLKLDLPSSVWNNILTERCIPLRLKRNWDRAELWVARFLMGIRHSPYYHDKPTNLEDVVEEFIPDSEIGDSIKRFYGTSKDRLSQLSVDKELQSLDPISWAKNTYLESRLLRRAIFDGLLVLR